VPQTLVAGGGKAIDPGEVEDPGSQFRRHLAGAVGRAGIDDDDFAHEVGHRAEGVGKVVLFVASDEAEGDGRFHGVPKRDRNARGEAKGATTGARCSTSWKTPPLYVRETASASKRMRNGREG